MSSKTKIFIIHMKELIYTGIFIVLGIILLLLLISMFTPKESAPVTPAPQKTEQEALSASASHFYKID